MKDKSNFSELTFTPVEEVTSPNKDAFEHSFTMRGFHSPKWKGRKMLNVGREQLRTKEQLIAQLFPPEVFAANEVKLLRWVAVVRGSASSNLHSFLFPYTKQKRLRRCKKRKLRKC